MAFVRVMCKAAKIEKLRKELEDEKKKSVEASQGKETQYSVKQRYRHFWINLKSKIGNWFRKKCTFPKHSCMYRTVYKLQHDGTCENFTLKSIVGFISGFFLTYIFFMFFVFILNFKLSTATIMCSFFGSVLTIGLAFSYKVRCVVFLLLPQFFSKRGRQALMAYAFILAITGPAKNTLHNMGILSESLACGQEQLKAAVKQIIDVVKKPFYAIRDAIKAVVKTVKVIVKKIKEVLLTIKRTIMAILRVIKAAFQFLGKILNICNKELGTPFERCTRVFENAITDCHAKLGPMFSWLCSITYLVQAVCYIVKIFDFICMIIDFISDSIIGVVIRKVKIFVRHIRTMFYVRIKFSHSFHFETNQSKSMSEITTGIVTEIRHRTENILTVFDFMSCATSLFFLFIILRVLHYRYKFLTSERFDNRFITRDFRDVDMKRAQLEKETVLPLNHRERSLYITVTSIRLVKSEKVKLSKAAVVLGMTTLKLSTHMMADYALYWVLTVIRYHARFQSTVQAPNVVGLHIEGQGFIATLLKSIVKAFQPLGIKLEIDTVPCLPDPIPPDYDRYIQIASLLILCWILTIFEPYGLRLRHSVMCFYHPTRARQRAIWLYNHIMRSRLSFLKFARRQLRRKVNGARGITKITFKEFLRANIKFKWFRLCLGSDKQDACLLCGEVFRESDPIKPIRCIKPGCTGIYCEQCYADLQNLCTVCMEPIQYGDLSDISEEKDSSGDEEPPEKKKKKKKKRCTISKCLKRKHDDDSDDEEGGLLQTRPDDLPESEKSDSDYSSGVSTDNSYSYQNKKDLTSEPQDASTPKFSDVEKQNIPNHASWHSFTKQGDSKNRPESNEKRVGLQKFVLNVELDKEGSLEEASSLSLQQSEFEFVPDDTGSHLEKILHTAELDKTNTVEENEDLLSTSHSSILSELELEELSVQTSEMIFKEGSGETFTVPRNKSDEDTNRNQLPFGGTSGKQLKDDKKYWQTDEKLILPEKLPKTDHANKQEVDKFRLPKMHKKTLNRDNSQRQQNGNDLAQRDIKPKNSKEYDEDLILLEKRPRTVQENKQVVDKFNLPEIHKKTLDTPYKDNSQRQQNGNDRAERDIKPKKSKEYEENLILLEKRPRTVQENKQEIEKFNLPEIHKKTLDTPYRDNSQRQQVGNDFAQRDIKRKKSKEYDKNLILPKKPFKTIHDRYITPKQQKGIGIAQRRIKGKGQEDDESTLSEESTRILKVPSESDSNKQNTFDKHKIPYRNIGNYRQSKHVEPSANTNRQQENVPLTDRILRSFSSESTYESPLFKTTQSGLSSETETTFIETPKKNTRRTFLSGTSSSLDSEIRKCQKCGKFQHIPIPPLNLNFDSPINSDSTPPTVTDRFRKNVKYEIIQETPTNSYTSRNSSTSRSNPISPRSPINVNYQIYVPRYDTFVDCTELLNITTGQKCNDNSSEKEKAIAKKISEYKHIQRQKRIKDIVKNKNLLPNSRQSNTGPNSENAFSAFFTSNVDSSATKQNSSCTQEEEKVNPNIPKSKKNNRDVYKIKVKDYYREINRKQPTDNPTVTKDQNKLVKFIKRIFRKEKDDTELSKSSKSKFLLGECDKRFVILSPKLTEEISSANDDNSGTIASTSTSGDEFLNEHSTGTSTRSSSSSLMGSTASHIRGGAESKLENSEQAITTSGTSEITTSAITPSDTVTTTTTDTNQKDEHVVSSDSEISDIDIFFGRKSAAKYRKRKLANNKQSPDSDSSTKTEGTQMNINTNKNNSIISAEGSTPRYSRQPAERDQDPCSQQMKRFALISDVENCWCDNTNMNKIMSDPYTSSEISPNYIDNVRGRCYTYPCKSPQHTENFNENYNNSNQTPNTNNNKAMCVQYPSNEIHPGYIENIRNRCCSCPIKPQKNFNMEMMHEAHSYPNQSPRLPPCCSNEPTRERRPTLNSPQEFRNKTRSSSEERRGYSPAIRFSRSTEASAQIVREYNGPCRPPTAVYCNCPPRTPKIDEIRGRLMEYSGGEPNYNPNYNGSPTKESFLPNSMPLRNNTEENQYPNNYCACNSYEISSADVSPRTAVDDDAVSYCSGCSGRSKFPDLVYQNTDEFFELVNELGDTLSQRNRERVQKTMREFEIKSSQNKNLDKPIIFESDCEERSERHYSCQTPCNRCPGKTHTHQPSTTKFTKVETRRESLTRCQNHPQRYGYVGKVVQHMDRNVDNEIGRQPKFNKSGSNTHWELNARTGEWYKVYDDYYDYGNEYYNPPPPSPPPFRQTCICERSPRRFYPRNSPERQMENYVPPPPRNGKCNNCGFSRNSAY